VPDPGSACCPRITFGIDSDTGVYEPSPGKVGLTVNGVWSTRDEFFAYCIARQLLSPIEAVAALAWLGALPDGVLVEPDGEREP